MGAAVFAAGPQIVARTVTAGDRHPADSSAFTPADAALVLGARVWEDGRPSLFLRQRVEAAAQLYAAGHVSRLVLTGAGRNREGLDETASMHRTARDLGIPEEALLRDPYGHDTRASARNARDAGVTSAIVCTQEFHLPRAMWLCRSVGLEVQGAYPPVLWTRHHTARGYVRELPASWKAALEIVRDAALEDVPR